MKNGFSLVQFVEISITTVIMKTHMEAPKKIKHRTIYHVIPFGCR